jgi:hypothetical protein
MSKSQAALQESINYISYFLQHGSILQNFKFPRLHMPSVAGYNPEHYAEIGRKIDSGKIPVLLAESAVDGAKAFYELGSNCLNLTKATAPLNTPEHWGTIVHEATHMIQDMKKWRISLAEMEADAHFAQALFLYYKGVSFSSGYMPSFESAAKAFASGDKKEFKKKCPTMIAEAGMKYFGKKGYEDPYVKNKMDGI